MALKTNYEDGDVIFAEFLNNTNKVVNDIVEHGGGGGTPGADIENGMLIVENDGIKYAVPVSPYVAPNSPTYTVSGSNTSSSRNVVFACSTDGAIIKYSINGGSWIDGNSYTCVASSSVKETETIIAVKAVKNGLESAVVNISVITSRNVAKPTISASGNKYSLSRTITIDCATDEVTIYYTTDGTQPTTSSAVYSSANKPTINATKTIKAIAVKSNWVNSAVATSSEYVVGALKMWWGIVSSVPTTDANVLSLGNSIEKDALPATFTIPSGTDTIGKKLVFACKKGVNVSGMFGGGFEYQNAPTITTSYNIYTISDLAKIDGMSWVIQ